MNIYQRKSTGRLLTVVLSLCMFAAIFVNTELSYAAEAGYGKLVAKETSLHKQQTIVKKAEPVLIITGKDAEAGDGFQGNYKYLTKAQLDSITSEAMADQYFASQKRDSYINRVTYSARTKDEKGGWGKFSISGLDLAAVAESLGINTDPELTIYARAADGFTKTLKGLFADPLYSFSEDQADKGTAVAPAIALRWEPVTQNMPSLSAPHLVFGQTETGDYNMMNWIKELKCLWLGDKETVLSIKLNDKTINLSLADIISTKSGIYTADISSSDGGQGAAIIAEGVPLDKLLKDADIPENAIIKTDTSAAIAEPSDYFLAYDAKLADGGKVKTDAQLLLYGPDGKESPVKSLGVTLSAPGQVKGLKASVKTYNSVKLSWNKVSGAESYNIYRSEKGGKYEIYENTEAASFIDKNLKTGTPYSYKIKACITVGSQDLEGNFSSPAGATPVLGKTSLKLSKSGKNGIKASWSKVSGASGYELKVGVNKAVTKKTKTYKLKVSAKSKIITGMKKGTYYAKVRPYRTVDGKAFYGTYSPVKSIKR